jgi:hypothetical protein
LSDAIHAVYVELSKLEQIEKKPVEEMTDLEKRTVFLRYASMPKYREKLNKVIETQEALQMAGEFKKRTVSIYSCLFHIAPSPGVYWN